jgi:hypothetical protein
MFSKIAMAAIVATATNAISLKASTASMDTSAVHLDDAADFEVHFGGPATLAQSAP